MTSNRRRLRLSAVLCLVLPALAVADQPPPVGTCRPPTPTSGSRTAVILAINDVYRIAGLDGGAVGGLARLRALRRELEQEHPDLLLLHGGDFLFPSFMSRTFYGQQMVDVLNRMDGDPEAHDPRMFVVFGNHEFEQRSCRDASLLKRRIDESQFRWLGSNVVFALTSQGDPQVYSDNFLALGTVIESGGIRIGLFGLTIPTDGVEYVQSFAGRLTTARQMTADLRAQGAEVVVALTHLNARDDRRLLADLEDQGPDLIIGGHDHERLVCTACGRLAIKADADARTASVVWLTLPATGSAGPLQVDHCFRALAGSDPVPDPEVEARVQEWQARHETAFCTAAKEPAGCLEKKLGRTQTLLDAEEYKIRGEESSLGNWIADQMVDAFKDCGAQAAFLNAGGLRLNQDLPAGSDVLRSHLEELFQYPTNLYLLRIKGQTLQDVVSHALVGWPGAGNWLQISGFSFTHDVTGKTAKELQLGPPKSGKPVKPDDDVLVVVNDYLIDPKLGQDGYTMLSRAQVVQGCAANGTDLKARVVAALAGAEPRGIAPVVEDRIRQKRPDSVDFCQSEDD